MLLGASVLSRGFGLKYSNTALNEAGPINETDI